MKDLVLGILVAFVVTLSPILAIVYVGEYYDEKACAEYSAISGLETKYIKFDRCYVKASSGWVQQHIYTLRGY